jgi:hypothetical protein
MRQTKFRAMDQFSDSWVYGQAFFVDQDNGQGYISNGISRHELVRKETVGEYAGRKDNSGEEIYEGDVFCLPSGPNYFVVFKDGLFCLERITQRTGIEGYDIQPFPVVEAGSDNFVIAGNVYENPELLSEATK